MADSTDEKDVGEPANTKSEASLNEFIPAKEQETINANEENKDMEVHHHPDLHHRPKLWKEYFLEFVMIFLAVTLGFFAENIRERISDSDKAKVFAVSLYQDFKTDSTSLAQIINFTVEKIRTLDSLDYFIHQPGNRSRDSDLYRCTLYLISTSPFDHINGAYEQVKNTGSLRFFSQSLIDNLNSYEVISLKLKMMEDWENKNLYEQVIPNAGQMFNFRVFDDFRSNSSISHDMYFKNRDTESVDILLNQSNIIKHLRQRQLIQQKSLMQKAGQILADLKNEYRLK